VVVGLLMLTLAVFFSLRGSLTGRHTKHLEVLSLYWHFVDAVWVVVFLVVYVIGR
jgi:cytochrome c oxidase subunit 3/cytochrome o ubiquinol oxidase subunit 3